MATLPQNFNPLSPLGFQFGIQKLPNVNFYCQAANLPGISVGDPDYSTPFAQIPVPGDKAIFEPLQITFLVDENLENYLSIQRWIMALGFPINYEQYVSFISEDQRGVTSDLAKNYSDGTLIVLNNQNNPIHTVTFVDLFPVAIDQLSFTNTVEDVQYITCNASFRYSYFKVD